MTRLFTTTALALALSAISLSATLAQGGAGPGWRIGMMGGGCPTLGMMGQGTMSGMWEWGDGGPGNRGPGMMGRQPRVGAIVQGRLAYLKGELDITAAQTEAWNGYAEAVTNRIDLMQGMRQAMVEAMQEGTAIERMDVRISNMEAMLAAMKALKPATEKLYAVLTDDQKKMADQLIGADCGAM